MCGNISVLDRVGPPAADGEIRAAAPQFVRKLGGFATPSAENEAGARAAARPGRRS